MSDISICPRCEGTGLYRRLTNPPKACALCDGSGRIGIGGEAWVDSAHEWIRQYALPALEPFEKVDDFNYVSLLADCRRIKVALAHLPDGFRAALEGGKPHE